MKRSQVAAVLLLTFLLLSMQLRTSPIALACSCGSYSAAAQYGGAKIVFSGRTLSMETQKVPGRTDGWTASKNIYTFEVTRSWKGTPSSRLKVYYMSDDTGPEGQVLYNSCEPESGFIIGEEYIVYAGSEDKDSIHLAHYGGCSGTRLMKSAAEDIKVLETITGSRAQAGMPGAAEALQVTIIVVAAIGLCVIADLALRKFTPH
ncbi:MAG TPA: hypothetical protein VF826_19590 [Chloroflexia bacterium]